MQLGWIDFSKTEQSKILSVLELLGQGTLDELGVAPVRDGFANLFFPGTSTIQTRAKYFLLIPYIFRDLERSGEYHLQSIRKALSALERDCASKMWLQNRSEFGLIGSSSLQNGGWVKRPPSDIYWAGLKKYGIFLYADFTMEEYLKSVCALNQKKSAVHKLGNRKDQAEENSCDDADAGGLSSARFWNIPTYEPNWKDHISMQLTKAEAEFLRGQMIKTCSNSFLGFILESQRTDLLQYDSFRALGDCRQTFPEQIQKDYSMAQAFSEFLFCIRIVYNRLVSNYQNEAANIEFGNRHKGFPKTADIDLAEIFTRLQIQDKYLRRFLEAAQKDMLENQMKKLEDHIRDREIFLKGESRAKTAHPGELDPRTWVGGGYLDYRFSTARRLLLDIFEGANKNAEP